MLTRKDALRLIKSIADFANAPLDIREEEDATVIEVRLKPEAAQQIPSLAESTPRRYRVLHIEDTDRLADLVYYYLRTQYDVDTAQTGEEGLERALKQDYDYILMDLRLGDGMDGYQLTELLRGIERYATTPIIALSAYSSRRDVEKCIEVGCSAFISKPFLKDDLLKLMRQLEAKIPNRNP